MNNLFHQEFHQRDNEKLEKQLKELSIPYDYDTKEYPIEVLLQKFRKTGLGKIFIPTYQRNFVWKKEMKCRFIESLFLGVPVQPLFAAAILETGNLELIDGSQRTQTIEEFVYKGLRLDGLEKLTTLNGFAFSDLSEARQYHFNLINVRLHVVTSRADFEIRKDIFRRINTTGEKLSDSEERAGVFASPFYDFIVECVANGKFKDLSRSKAEAKTDIRKVDEDLVARFFAYAEKGIQNIKRGGKSVIDDYLAEKVKLGTDFGYDEKVKDFNDMLDFVEKHFEFGFKKTKNASTTPNVRFEAIALGVHFALKENPTLVPAYMDWLYSDEFAEKTTSDSSGNTGRLAERVNFVKDCLLNKISKNKLNFKNINKNTDNQAELYAGND